MVYEARKMLACGLAADVARHSLQHHAKLTQAEAEGVIKAARRQLKAHLEQAEAPTRAELIEMHRALYADCMAGNKPRLDTAAKVLRSLTDVVLSMPDTGGAFDEKDPRGYLVTLLQRQAQGRHVPPAVMAAAARAVATLAAGEPEGPGKGDDAAPSPPPATLAEAAERALRIVQGGHA
jgi:hypothetical protein